ncbi:hypothetical protein H6P81_013159 [Aristolochia fimbriata]|uniref:Uncharacterized protein n=1 Tax=Aristolochia fimbriata TaxID=158543 RepID=A0AAV7EH13_ARIFI|nr:hypothetical protein H6P81_013159 [Aristolochia fimbriata]
MELDSQRANLCNEHAHSRLLKAGWDLANTPHTVQIENFLKEAELKVLKDQEFKAGLKKAGIPINVRTRTDKGKMQGYEALGSHHPQHDQEEVGFSSSVEKYQPVDVFFDVFGEQGLLFCDGYGVFFGPASPTQSRGTLRTMP